jgi:hypothetical protein
MKESAKSQDERVTFPPLKIEKRSRLPDPSPQTPRKKKAFRLESPTPLEEDELNFPQGGFIV